MRLVFCLILILCLPLPTLTKDIQLTIYFFFISSQMAFSIPICNLCGASNPCVDFKNILFNLFQLSCLAHEFSSGKPILRGLPQSEKPTYLQRLPVRQFSLRMINFAPDHSDIFKLQENFCVPSGCNFATVAAILINCERFCLQDVSCPSKVSTLSLLQKPGAISNLNKRQCALKFN